MNVIKLNNTILNCSRLNSSGILDAKKKGPQITYEDVDLIGVDTLTVENAKADSITRLLVGGGCSQSGTPTPTTPKTILSSKGAITYQHGKNLLEVKDANIVVGNYINNAGVITTSLPNMFFQRFIAVKANTAYTLSASEELNYANFMEYDADGVFIKRTLYGSSSERAGASVTHTMGETTSFVIIGSNVNSNKYPSITKDDVKGIKWMFNEGSKALSYQAYKGEIVIDGADEISVYSKNLLVGELVSKGYASTGAVSSSTTFCGNLYKIPVVEGQKYTVSWGNLPDGLSGVFVNTWLKDGSWNARQAISASDHLTYTIPSGVGEVNFTLYKTGGITIGADTWIQVELGDVATDYVPAVAPSVASNQPLLGVGDFKDTQELIAGVVNRKVGVTILDGTEDVSTSNSAYTIGISAKIRTKTTLLCTHFKHSTATSSALANNTIISFSSQNVGFRNDACADVESFRQFLAREYAKGTPVTIVYPLANESNEQVTGQAISNPKGTVTIVRDAEVSVLDIEATLKVEKAQGGAEFTFSIESGQKGLLTYTAKEGMTWLEWCNSDYNNDDCGWETYEGGKVDGNYEESWFGGQWESVVDNETGSTVASNDVIQPKTYGVMLMS